MELFVDALLDALVDGVKMLPFLYLAYLLIEWLERHHGESIEGALAGGGRWGFIPGALLGCVPQCGFSAVASNLYASRVITPGTLLAVFIATSDEAIPLLAAEPSQWVTLVLLLACKVAFAIVGGWLLDIPLRHILPHSLYGGPRRRRGLPRGTRGDEQHLFGGSAPHAGNFCVHPAVQLYHQSAV